VEIVMISSEAIPFAKTGGLADVCGALPRKLANLGHRCSVFLPGYSQIHRAGVDIQPTNVGFSVPIAGRQVACRILKATIGDGPVDFYFVDQPHYFDRAGLYGDRSGDYRDNCERFSFFCRASLMAMESLRLPAQIIHCHDWQTGLVPAILKTQFRENTWFARAASVFTIHNMAYQGRYWMHDMPLTGLDWSHFNWQEMEYYGDISLLKTGIVFADRLTTVSPTYAKEIQTEALGCGLEAVLSSRNADLFGIVNGVDYQTWDPIRDELLPQTYSLESWQSGKASAKSALLQELELPNEPNVPLIGLIGRLAEQKGWDLVIPMLRNRIDRDGARWVILGSGEARFQDALAELRNRAPHRLAFRAEFSESFAHRIEAASDMFLMPSRYEPCGLNQLYSLRYGAVPIVHATGGLVDTVTDTNDESMHNNTATGFMFSSYDIASLESTLDRALHLFYHSQEDWRRIVERGMQQDWSWSHSASQYEQVYAAALNSVPT
jgi:starch synthase